MFLRGDGGVELQELMDVIDRLKAAGVEKVGIVTKLPRRAMTEDVTDVIVARSQQTDRAADAMVAVVDRRARRARRGSWCFVPASWRGPSMKRRER